jgi:hypothetical protein
MLSSRDGSAFSWTDHSNIHLTQIQEFCCFEFHPKIPNYNTQIPNNIQTQNSNIQNIPIALLFGSKSNRLF